MLCSSWRRVLPTPLLSLRGVRGCASLPSEDEVRKAYAVLGATSSYAYADAKKKYMDLAKQHHPDVSSDTSGSVGSSRMVELNNAYSVVTRFHKAGRTITPPRTNTNGSGGGRTGPSSSGWGYSAPHSSGDKAYQPWHEDIDPLMYEMMWEEMRRQNDEDAFARGSSSSAGPESPYYGSTPPWSEPGGGGSYRARRYGQPGKQQGDKNRKGDNSNNNNNNNASKGQQQQQQKTTTWPEADLQALVNMYQDGKSFEFIGNALGKDTASVVSEFNSWSNDKKKNKGNRSNNNNKKRYHRNQHRQPYYHVEFPEGMPYGMHEYYEDAMGDDEDDPYGYGMGAGDEFGDPYDSYGGGMDDGSIPFNGTHYMSGGPRRGSPPHFSPNGNRNNNSNNNNNKKPYNNKKWRNSGK